MTLHLASTRRQEFTGVMVSCLAYPGTAAMGARGSVLVLWRGRASKSMYHILVRLDGTLDDDHRLLDCAHCRSKTLKHPLVMQLR